MKLRPTKNEVLIEFPKAQEQSEGGIIIPEVNHGDKSKSRGVVIAKGPKAMKEIPIGASVLVQPINGKFLFNNSIKLVEDSLIECIIT